MKRYSAPRALLFFGLFFALASPPRLGALLAQASQGLPSGRADEVGMSSDRLARIRAAMQRYVDRKDVPGVVTLVARHGRVIHFEALGYRDV
jgi:hypothetical protein